MTKSFTALLLIFAFNSTVWTESAEAYSCAKNHQVWTRQQSLDNPLDLYERLAQRDQSHLTLGDIEFIKNDLLRTKMALQNILKADAKIWMKELEGLLKNNVPQKDLLNFYARLTIHLQNQYKSGMSSEDLGFVANLETVQSFIVDAVSYNPGKLPVIILPMHGNLNEGDFVRTNGVPLYYAGITFRKQTHGDGVVFGPADFFIHDLFHTELMSLLLRNTFNEIKKIDPGAIPITLVRKWNQLANSQLNQETEKPMFLKMHEEATVIQ